ncbi:MAG: murein L,D-transpeptidase catalytic domain family protein [Proteobacteria bacterium]|nr:murein L,D-transpeptidase catalytic domain family protein [Pseudomonadota bacterium]
MQILSLVLVLVGCSSVAAVPESQPTASQLSPKVAEAAFKAYKCAIQRDEVTRNRMAIIDFNLPSSAKRLWVFDMEESTLLHHELVSHGKNSGGLWATSFSDVSGSKQSSLGAYVTAETYSGKHGYSLKLDGLEEGFNKNARTRAIVIHGADYVSEEFVDKQGRLGRSWGCPAVSTAVSEELIDDIRGGALVLAHFNDKKWLAEAAFLHCSR